MPDPWSLVPCREHPETFDRVFHGEAPLDSGHPVSRDEYAEAVEDAQYVCARCPLRAECLQRALDDEEDFGVWGGHTRAERRTLRRAAAKQEQLDEEPTAA